MQLMKNVVLFFTLSMLVLTTVSAFFLLESPQQEQSVESKVVSKVAKKIAAPKKRLSLEAPQEMSVREKKERYFSLVYPHVQKVYTDLMEQFESVKASLESGEYTDEIVRLKEEYGVESDEELLFALKPHPPSIVLAQGALESSWATSRFFIEAKNIFGMWSVNPDEPRIAAAQKRSGERTIWLRKFDSLEESVEEYYRTIGRAEAYREFREARFMSDDPFDMIPKLDKYAETGDEYPKELTQLILYNNLTDYDE